MTAFLNGTAGLLLDYYLAAAVLLLLVLCAGKLLRQPVERMAVAWGTVAGLFLLIALCALPAWPRISLAPVAPTPEIVTQTQALISTPYSQPDDLRAVPAHNFSQPPQGQKLKPLPKMERHAPSEVEGSADVAINVAPQRLPIKWAPLASGVFLSGSLIMLGWQIVGAIQLRRLVVASQQAPAFAVEALQAIVGSAARTPRLIVTRQFTSAAACGLWRPTILLPASVVSEPPADAAEQARLAALLSHEWAHLRGGDLWLLFLLRVLAIGMYAHPLYWLLRRRVSVDQELIADSIAAGACGRPQFARYLIEWARSTSHSSAPRAALGIWQRQAELSRRISMLLDERIRLRSACSRMDWLVSATTIAGVVMALSLVTLRPAPPAGSAVAAEPPVALEAPAVEAKNTEPDVKKVEVTLHGVCVDEKKRPIPGARARLLRCDAGADQVGAPMCRIRYSDLPEVLKDKNQEGLLMRWAYACDRKSQRLVADVLADKNGRFEFPPEIADKYWQSGAARVYVCVQAAGMATEWHYARADQQEALKPIDVTLRPAETLRGRVTDDAGRPVVGALIGAGEAHNLPNLVPGLHCAKTDADGRYEITDLPPLDVDDLMLAPTGGMAIEYLALTGWIEHPDFATHLIEFKKVPATVDAVLRRPATLTTRVVAAETGEPIAKAPVSRSSTVDGSVTVVSDEHGEFVASGLEPGSYTISTMLTDRPPVHQTIDLKPGPNELVLKPRRGGVIKGRLIDDATGKPPIKPAENTLHGQVHVLTALDASKPEEGAGGPVNSETAEFQIAVRPGKNHVSLLMLDQSSGVTWVLTDPDRWQTQGVDVTQDQTVEIELRVKPNKLHTQHEYAGFAKWRDELVANKKPMSLRTLQLIFEGGQSYVERENVNGAEEIVAISVAVMGGPDGDNNALIGQFVINVQIERSVLAHIGSFPHLRSLQLFHPPGPADAMLESLRGLQDLETLSVIDVLDFTAAGVKYLAALPKLRSVSLLSQTFDDAALGELARLPALRELATSGKFTDDGLAALAANPELTTLIIAKTGDGQLTDASLVHLAKLTKLKQLDLTEVMSVAEQFAVEPVIPRHWAITDDGLRHLAALTELEELSIHVPHLTDACLVHLRGLKRLKRLNTGDSKITPEGLAELRKHLPELKKPPKPAEIFNGQAWPAVPDEEDEK
jgi:beta-lactamase regulating signal transducer with metallopeptidase domain